MNNVDKLIAPMNLTDELLNTQLYDKIEEYKTLEYKKRNCRLEEYKEEIKDYYKILFDFETITSGAKHEPHLCWIYNDEIQQEFVGIDNCAIDMLNNLPTDKHEIILIAYNANCDCRFIQQYVQNVRPIVKSNRMRMLKGIYYNPIHKNKIKIVIKDSYRLIPMALHEFGKCFKLDCHKEVMTYAIYTYENVSLGVCRIQDALDVLKKEDKQPLLDNIETWDCVLGKGMNDQMFDLIK